MPHLYEAILPKPSDHIYLSLTPSFLNVPGFISLTWPVFPFIDFVFKFLLRALYNEKIQSENSPHPISGSPCNRYIPGRTSCYTSIPEGQSFPLIHHDRHYTDGCQLYIFFNPAPFWFYLRQAEKSDSPSCWVPLCRYRVFFIVSTLKVYIRPHARCHKWIWNRLIPSRRI